MLILYASCLMRSRIASERGTIITTKLIIPAIGIILGAEDGRGSPASPMEKLQNVMLFGFRGFQQEPFIDDQQDRVGIFPLDFLVCAIVTCHLQFQEQIRKPDIFRFVTLLTCFHPERTGQISLSTSGSPGDKEIPVLCDIFTGCKPLNQRTVQLAP